MDRSIISCMETGLCVINKVQNDAEIQHVQMQGKIQYCTDYKKDMGENSLWEGVD